MYKEMGDLIGDAGGTTKTSVERKLTTTFKDMASGRDKRLEIVPHASRMCWTWSRGRPAHYTYEQIMKVVEAQRLCHLEEREKLVDQGRADKQREMDERDHQIAKMQAELDLFKAQSAI
ncbi:hypothetical protein EDD22DRAFT_851504 [Suillus occidentalis]|nr:hypothetical protein EDD22DRAFT_851504 [Suillus occidentalis]